MHLFKSDLWLREQELEKGKSFLYLKKHWRKEVIKKQDKTMKKLIWYGSPKCLALVQSLGPNTTGNSDKLGTNLETLIKVGGSQCSQACWRLWQILQGGKLAMYIEPGISQTDLRAGVSSKIAFYCMARSKGGKKKIAEHDWNLRKKSLAALGCILCIV